MGKGTNDSIMSDFLDQSVQDCDGNEIKISRLLNKKTLFYMYSERTCSPCVEQEIKLISKYDGIKNIIILANYEDTNKFKKFCQLNEPKVKSYTGSSSDLLGMHHYISYYIVLNKDKSISDLFFPDKYSIDSSVKFLSETLN